MDFEESLITILSRHLDRDTGTPPNLAASIRYSLLAPGKRIRPRLLLETGGMLGIPKEALIAAAAALEMIHCFTLIHDDLPCMDNDDFRRGLPSNHKKFGESLALLAGDALLSLAFDVFMDAAPLLPGDRFTSGLRRLLWASGPRGVIGGQAAEELMGAHSKLSELDDMHARKTGALFSAAILVPMDFAGIRESEPKGAALALFAATLGNAFQVADDLEDDEKGDPLSILFFMESTEAALKTAARLHEAMRSIEKTWGSDSAHVLGIAREVIQSLEKKRK